MATATEAPASITAEGPTSHTPNQAEQPARRLGQLSQTQIAYLLRGIDANRVGEDGKGFAHVEAWDIRRHLIRVFGFGGHDTDLLETTLIAETSIPNHQKFGRNGQPYGKPYEAWTVIYRVAVRLAVKVDGIELGHWHGIATGDATNQPSRADAHDLALKTADSQALKRAATNLGDQFGLSLYNKGSLAPVVQASLAYWKPQTEQQFKDDKVEPEPEVAAARQEAEAAAQAPQQEQAQAPRPAQPSAPTQPKDDKAAHLDRLMSQVRDCWKHPDVLTQIQGDAETHEVIDDQVQDPFGNWVPFRTLLAVRIAELKQAAKGGDTERSAA